MHRLIILFLPLIPVASVPAARWDTQAAARAFLQARAKRAEIAQDTNPTLGQYLECARLYRLVHVKDPHYGRTGEAIYEEGLVYQEAADRLAKPEYYRRAAARFRLLVKDYGGNRNCADALVRLGAICSTHLDDESGAEEAYKILHSEYGYSEKTIQQLRATLNLKPKALPAAEPLPQVERRTTAPETDSQSLPSSAVPSMVQNLRFWTTTDYTRVIVDLDSDAKYEEKRISDPDRVYFDIANARLSPDLANRSFKLQDDILKQVRIAQNRTDVVRIVLDVSSMEGISTSELHDPFRIVIDLRRKGSAAQQPSPTIPAGSSKAPAIAAPKQPPPPAVTELESLPAQKPAKQPEPAVQSQPKEVAPAVSSVTKKKKAETAAAEIKTPPLTTSKPALPTGRGDRTLTRILGLKVGRIVIDPGHGGHDVGTIGPGGLLEKDLVLALARSLKRMISEKIGAEVVLTRDNDTYLSLEERTAIANQHKADLFISIHANSSRIHTISGVETYYLDFARSDAEREIAARENAMSDNNFRDLEDLIKKIAQADKSTESRELASIIQKKLYSGARKVLPQTQDRGVRSAPFVVLIGANMPSVLAEIAFISNPKDERLLKKESTRQSIVKALYAGIEGYLKTLGSDVVQTQSSQGK